MSLRVLRPGLLATIQDLGRPGLQRYGVAVGGAMDWLALRVANLLVGNNENEAGLEMTLLGPDLEFQQDTLIAICGGDLSPRIGEAEVPQDRPVLVRAGTTLSCGAARRGCRAYLAIAGGFDVPEILGSRSTYLRAGIGGFEGRPLQAGDTLRFRMVVGVPALAGVLGEEPPAEAGTPTPFASCRWRAGVSADDWAERAIRVVRGSEFDMLSLASQDQLFTAEFTVSPQSDRMGYRLSGPPLELSSAGGLISTAVCPGTIQVPPDGQPILLMADCATTGGYPKVAHVASVDLPRMAQQKPGDSFSLREISLEEAHNLYRKREAAMRRLKVALQLKYFGPAP